MLLRRRFSRLGVILGVTLGASSLAPSAMGADGGRVRVGMLAAPQPALRGLVTATQLGADWQVTGTSRRSFSGKVSNGYSELPSGQAIVGQYKAIDTEFLAYGGTSPKQATYVSDNAFLFPSRNEASVDFHKLQSAWRQAASVLEDHRDVYKVKPLAFDRRLQGAFSVSYLPSAGPPMVYLLAGRYILKVEVSLYTGNPNKKSILGHVVSLAVAASVHLPK